MRADRRHSLVAGTATSALVVAAVVALHGLGTGALAAPSVGSWAAFEDWARARNGPEIAFALLRLLALGVAVPLAATTALALAGQLLHLPALVQAARLGTLPPFRGLVRRAAGLALSASSVVTVAAPAAHPPREATAVVIERIDPTQGTATMTAVPPGSATMTPIPAAPTSPGPSPARRHLVRPGDHLWAIAEQDLAGQLGRAPTDREIDPHWRALVSANPQLADPDLLLPGTLVVVPAIASAVS